MIIPEYHELENVYNGKNILPFISRNVQSFTTNANDFPQDEKNKKIHCLYQNVADFSNMVVTHVNSFSLLHLKIFSIPYHFEEIDEILDSLYI